MSEMDELLRKARKAHFRALMLRTLLFALIAANAGAVAYLAMAVEKMAAAGGG